MSTLFHLATRFATSLSRRPPNASDEQWAQSWLQPPEIALWKRLPAPDRRHALAVARATELRLGSVTERPVMAAALLHDVGKLESGLGTLGRVAATIAGVVRGRHRLRPTGRFGRYVQHGDLGAALLTEAGSDALTVSWAREHHRDAAHWTLPRAIADALKAGDDD